MKSNFRLLIVILIILSFPVGCNLISSSENTQNDFTDITIALDWYPWSNHAGIFVAKEKGYYSENQLRVSIYTPSNPSNILQTVGSGKDDFGISYQTDVLMAKAEGVPVTSIAAIVQHPLNSIMTLKESGITRPYHLEGKRIGYPGIPTDELLLKTMIEYDGGNIENIKLMNVGYDLVTALISKKVDAIIGAYWVHESFIIEEQGYEINILKMEDWGVPDFYELVIVTNEKTVDNKPELINKFINSTFKGYEYSINNPKEAINIMSSINPEIDIELETAGIKLLLPLWKKENGQFGWQDKSKWEKLAIWMLEQQLLNKPVNLDKAFTNQFVRLD
jgi:putative hydroxymethylpyrimidine transport system substrate-binding protein